MFHLCKQSRVYNGLPYCGPTSDGVPAHTLFPYKTMAQACGNVNPCDGSIVSEDYDRAEEILNAAAVGVDYYYEREIDASHTNLRENQFKQMMELLDKVHP